MPYVPRPPVGTICQPCQAGEHDPRFHSELGCLAAVAPVPQDIPCACNVAVRRNITEDYDSPDE